jgi:hypothetical protein
MTPKTLNPNRAEADLICFRQKDGAIEIELRAINTLLLAQAVINIHHGCTAGTDVGSPIYSVPGFLRTFCFRRAGSSAWTNAARAVSSPNACLEQWSSMRGEAAA